MRTLCAADRYRLSFTSTFDSKGMGRINNLKNGIKVEIDVADDTDVMGLTVPYYYQIGL